MFANTLTADDRYSFDNMQNFLQQLQTLLSEKRNAFSLFFTEILKCAWNLQHFDKKDESASLLFSEIIISERRCYWIV